MHIRCHRGLYLMSGHDDSFSIIDNETVTLAEEIVSALPNASGLDVAAAYFSITGYQKIVEGVEDLLNRGGVVRFLLGLHPTAGAKELLEVLRREQDRSGKERVAVRFIPPDPDRDFHAKVYIVKQPDTATLIVGSSNLSNKGLVNNLELNYREVVPLDSPKYEGIQQWFNHLFDDIAKEFSWATLEELFALPPYVPSQGLLPLPPLPAPPPALVDYTSHFIALQLRHLTVPIGGRIDPFWFQMRNVQEILSQFQTRIERGGIMVADEVGLGKTISAGMTIKELIVRRAAKRVLIVCPASLVIQWRNELEEKLDEQFTTVDTPIADGGAELWSDGNRLIVSIDRLRDEMVARQTPRSAWELREQWMKLNPHFDVVVIDESHYAKNPTSKRYAALSRLDCDFRILLTGTPIQNRELELYTQLALIAPALQPHERQSMESVYNLVSTLPAWKALKERVILRKLRRDADIKPLFAERQTPYWVEKKMSSDETLLYRDFALYISEQSKYYELISTQATARIVPFIKITYLREFCSSSAAILNALVGDDHDGSSEREWNSQQTTEGRTGGSDELAAHMKLKGKILRALRDGTIDIYANERDALAQVQEQNPDLDVEQVDDETLRINLSDADERELQAEVRLLNDFARRIQQCAPFAKERSFAEAVRAAVEHTPRRKVVIFTAYLPTGRTLIRLLQDAGLQAGFYHGELNEDERERLIDRFWERGRGKERPLDVLVATDAGGVGLNLQCANHVINYDLSWNPMVVEQRIGRVHRIGQLAKKVFVDNWFAEVDEVAFAKAGVTSVPSIESKNLRERLDEKVKLIQETLSLSDEVITDAILSDAEYIDALLKYQARRLTEEQYKAIKQRVIERTRGKLKTLSDLHALTSVVDEGKRREAAQHALLFDEYTRRMLNTLTMFDDVERTQHRDSTVTVTLSPNVEPSTPSVTLTTDRRTADDRKGEVELFSVRHPLLQLTVNRLLDDAPPDARKVVKLADIPDDSDRAASFMERSNLAWGEVKERLQNHTHAAQCNILLTYELQRGAAHTESVEKLVTVLVLDDGSTEVNDVLNGKLNLLPAEVTTGGAFVTDEQKQVALARAHQVLDEEVKQANQNSLEEVQLRYERRQEELSRESTRLAERLGELGEQIRRLEQNTNRTGADYLNRFKELDSERHRAQERLTELRNELRTLGHEQQTKYKEAQSSARPVEEPQLLSNCLYVFES